MKVAYVQMFYFAFVVTADASHHNWFAVLQMDHVKAYIS